ncbi:MAG: hypoxanthine phosphoribosyltransferase [Acidobacteria bacterium]|nr:MAG: hypoxanthine phosphoribosyltransferase [Acidobacteriota bacterium]
MSSETLEPQRTSPARVLFTQGEIQRQVDELAGRLESSLADGEVPILVGLMRGSLVLMADLVRRLSSVHVDFLSLSRFSQSESGSGRARIEKDLEIDITGRRIIFVEDVVDTGLTLSYLTSSFEARNPKSIEVLALLDKRARRIIDIPIDFAGFEIGDEFVLGYGLDYAQLYRNVPFLFGVDDLDVLVRQPDAYFSFARELMRGGEEAQQAAK